MTGAAQAVCALLVGHQDENVRLGHGPDHSLAQVYLATPARRGGVHLNARRMRELMIDARDVLVGDRDIGIPLQAVHQPRQAGAAKDAESALSAIHDPDRSSPAPAVA